MKRSPAKLALAIVAGAVVALALSWAVLLRFVESEAFRDGLRERAQVILGVPIEWERAEARPWPPSLVLHRPSLVLEAEATGSDSAPGLRWTAEAGELRPALRPLLRGDLRIEAVALSSGRVEVRDRFRRSPIEWRIEDAQLVATPTAPGDPVPIRVSGRLGPGTTFVAGGALLAVDGAWPEVRFDDVAFRSTDIGPPALVGRGTLRATGSPEEGLRIDADLDLGEAGSLQISGVRRGLEVLDVRVRGRDFDLGILRSVFTGLRLDVAGRATGILHFVGNEDASDRIEADLRIASARWRMPDYRIEGALPVVLTVEQPFSARPKGRIDLDLTATSLDYRGRFEKPRGMPAKLTTHFVRDASGEFRTESRVTLSGLDQILRPAGRPGASP